MTNPNTPNEAAAMMQEACVSRLRLIHKHTVKGSGYAAGVLDCIEAVASITLPTPTEPLPTVATTWAMPTKSHASLLRGFADENYVNNDHVSDAGIKVLSDADEQAGGDLVHMNRPTLCGANGTFEFTIHPNHATCPKCLLSLYYQQCTKLAGIKEKWEGAARLNSDLEARAEEAEKVNSELKGILLIAIDKLDGIKNPKPPEPK